MTGRNRGAGKAIDIEIDDRQSLATINPALMKKFIGMILAGKKAPGCAVSVVFSDDRYIAKLNREYLNRTGPTDVISFWYPDDFTADAGGAIRGDIVISTERAFNRAEEFGNRVSEEICLYVAHGVLHLLGFDDNTARGTTRMRAEEAKTMKAARRMFGDDFFEKAAANVIPACFKRGSRASDYLKQVP